MTTGSSKEQTASIALPHPMRKRATLSLIAAGLISAILTAIGQFKDDNAVSQFDAIGKGLQEPIAANLEVWHLVIGLAGVALLTMAAKYTWNSQQQVEAKAEEKHPKAPEAKEEKSEEHFKTQIDQLLNSLEKERYGLAQQFSKQGNITALGYLCVTFRQNEARPDFFQTLEQAIQACQNSPDPEGYLAEARYLLGQAYEIGNGYLPKNANRAFVLYEQAVKAGHPHAPGKLGECYEKGIGVPINIEKAETYYKNGDFSEGLIRIGKHYEKKGNLKKAQELYQAARSGEDLTRLGQRHEENRRLGQAYACYRLALTSEELSAVHQRFGGYYADGDGITQDLEKAYEYYTKPKAYEYYTKPEARGCYSLSPTLKIKICNIAYQLGEIEEKKSALKETPRKKSALKAALKGFFYYSAVIQYSEGIFALIPLCAKAQFNLGNCYILGKVGLKKDLIEAGLCFTQAAENKHPEALAALENVVKQMEKSDKNPPNTQQTPEEFKKKILQFKKTIEKLKAKTQEEELVEHKKNSPEELNDLDGVDGVEEKKGQEVSQISSIAAKMPELTGIAAATVASGGSPIYTTPPLSTLLAIEPKPPLSAGAPTDLPRIGVPGLSAT